MKNILFIFTFIFIINLSAQENRVKIYPFKSAVIEYKYEASFKGAHIKYIDDYGYKQADYIRKSENFGGNSAKLYETVILIGEKAYTIDPEDSTAAAGRNETYGYYLKNSGIPCKDISRALLQAEGGWHLTGYTDYLGKKCEVWKNGNSKKLIWNGLMLQSETNFMTMMVEKAISIKLNASIPQQKFEIPQGFRYIPSDVYQGFAGLELTFEKDSVKNESSANHIKVRFSSENLSGCNNFACFTVKGEKTVLQGDNGYNKIDHLIIKSQRPFMNNKAAILHPYESLMFITSDNKFGKMQIKEISKDGYKLRYALFNNGGLLLDYSEGSAVHSLSGIIITKNKNTLTIKSANGTLFLILNN